jgi:hypothetical protein
VVLLRRSDAGGWRVVARSATQMAAFNQPFQLGFAPGQQRHFQSPAQGETTALPVQAGDVVLAASDGLLDNLEEDALLAAVGAWSQRHPAAAVPPPPPPPQQQQQQQHQPSDAAAAAAASSSSSSPVHLDGQCDDALELAQRLAHDAAAASVDRSRDGPFARVAKDNDVLWTKGGRPDDITVAIARVVGGAAAAPGGAPAALTPDGIAARRARLRQAVPSLSFDDPTVTGNVRHALATPECGEDATWRLLPRLLLARGSEPPSVAPSSEPPRWQLAALQPAQQLTQAAASAGAAAAAPAKQVATAGVAPAAVKSSRGKRASQPWKLA